jgi:lysophospholipase L1-like esterase
VSEAGERLSWRAVSVGALVGAVLATVVMLIVFGISSPVGRADAPVTPTTPVAVTEDTPRITVIGDSWAEGIGATGLHGYAILAGQQLNWDYTVLGVGGTGYVNDGPGSTFADRIRQAVDSDPDVIVVEGSVNDRDSDTEDLTAAALRTLTQLRAQADPETQVVVIGAFQTPGYGAKTVTRINHALEAAADHAGVDFVDPVAAHWIDPTDDLLWADENHPNDVGHQRIADRLKALLRELLPS